MLIFHATISLPHEMKLFHLSYTQNKIGIAESDDDLFGGITSAEGSKGK